MRPAAFRYERSRRDSRGRLTGVGRPADAVEVAQDASERARQAGLTVSQSALLAEFPDQGLASTQARPGRRREQVVLDLVVQAAERQVGQPAAVDIAGGEYLAPQEVTPVGSCQDRHALVISSERAAEIEAEEALLHHDECH